MHGLKAAGIVLDRKILADLAVSTRMISLPWWKRLKHPSKDSCFETRRQGYALVSFFFFLHQARPGFRGRVTELDMDIISALEGLAPELEKASKKPLQPMNWKVCA